MKKEIINERQAMNKQIPGTPFYQCDYEEHWRVIGRSGDHEELLFSTTLGESVADKYACNFPKYPNGPTELEMRKVWVRRPE